MHFDLETAPQANYTHSMPVMDCPFTAQDRINGGKRAAEVRRQEKAELLRLREWFAELSAKEQLKQQAEVQATQPLDIVRVRERLDKIDELMQEAIDDKQWDTLSRAYERMFRVWCTLTKTPGPGNLKPSNKPQSQRRAMPEPVPCGPEPMAQEQVKPQAGSVSE